MKISEKIEAVIKDLRAGHLILVTDDVARENEADLLMAAEFITPEKINFFLNHARGLITNPISSKIAEELNLPLMVPENIGTLITGFTVSIDASTGIHSGITSLDRSITIKKLAQKDARPSDFTRPGHVFPLIANAGGVLVRPGHTEAAIDLMKLANLNEVAVLCETLNSAGLSLVGEELLEFAKTFKIKIISIQEIIHYLTAPKA